MKKATYEIDMCNGPLFRKILIFAIPLMLSGILQRLINAIDSMILGNFAGNEAFAAVSSTSALCTLILDLFVGLSVGVNVLCASYYGSGKKEHLTETVRTALSMALVCGIFLTVFGLVFSPALLRLMDTPENIFDKAALYMRIYFCSVPGMLIYNFGSAVLRSSGDSRRPFYYLLFAGAIKIIISFTLVVGFKLGVGAVGLATVLSQVVSGILILRCLKKVNSEYALTFQPMVLVPDRLKTILTLGIPAGVQSIVLSLANVMIQSSINSFGSDTIAGNSAASTLEGFVYISMSALYQTAICFTGQNYGAKKYKRIGKVFLYCQISVILTGLILGNLMNGFSAPLMKLYTSVPESIRVGQLRMSFLCAPYFLCGIMEVMAGLLRGLGYSLMPTLVSLTGICLFRVSWNAIIFHKYGTLESLYWCFPLSWVVTFLLYLLCFGISIFYQRRKQNKSIGGQNL